ncbi:MAG: type II toxin-antitoxin system VapC family toxin [Staphylothermus sp.]|nr:type II toxin-antitoxin system VapC family toxin [Staphylothermus sp.]
MSYIDTNVLIAYINPNDALHNSAIELLSKIEGDRYVSDLTIIELYSVFSRAMDLKDIEIDALVKYTIRETGVKRIDIMWKNIFNRAKEYAYALKLKTLDLLHLTIAVVYNCSLFITFDKDIIRKSKIIEGLTGIRIQGYPV